MAMRQSELSQFYHSLSIKLNGSNEFDNDNEFNEDFCNIKELTLSNCELLTTPKFQNYLNNIVKLNLSNNNIYDLPESIFSIEKLEYLNLDSNNIKQISANICDLKYLKELNLSKNNLSEMPSNVDQLEKLEILNISNNKVKYLPDSWMQLNNLTKLDISNNLFKQIPNCLREGMINIEFLDVSENENMNINGRIHSDKLKKFYAKYNKTIYTFPKWIFSGKLSEMNELEFEGTQFKTIKIPIFDKKLQLKKLNLQMCQLYDVTIDKIFINISSLEHLKIGNMPANMSIHNSFPSLPDKYICNPEFLKTIDISYTGLADVSKSIEKFSNLTKICFAKNFISWLPEEICNLKQLQVLDLSQNILIMLPQNLGSMTSLKILQVEYNHISSLPSSIINLKNLEYIDLFQNELTEMPEEIKYLSNLKALDLESNFFETDDIVHAISYSHLRNHLRIDKPYRFIGPQIINTEYDSDFHSCNPLYECDSSNTTELIEEESYNIDKVVEEENWNISDDFADEFDPFNPPPIPTPRWAIPSVFYRNKFDFCPADLHAPRIQDVIANAQANGQYPLPLSIVEGQFDDAD